MKNSEKNIYYLKDHILHTAFEDGGVIFNLEDRTSQTVNRTGSKILEALDGKGNVNEITVLLADSFEKPEDEIRRDVTAFLLKLYKRGWIDVR